MDKGVWRTIKGRKVFIKDGQSITGAMRESGEFKKAEAAEAQKPKPVKVRLTADIQQKFDNAKSANEQRKIMFDHIITKLRGKYTATDGRVVEITRKTAAKYTSKAPIEKLKVAPELARLIQSGVPVEEGDVEHKVYSKFAYYKVEFRIGKRKFTGKLNVGIRKDGSSALYDLNPYSEQK